MIPLRILHVADLGLASMDRSGLGSLLPWLKTQGHAVATVAIGEPTSEAGFEPCLGRRTDWWNWWRHGRRDAILAAGAWGADVVHAHGENALSPAIDVARGIAAQLVADPGGMAELTTQRLLRDPVIAAVLVPGEEYRSTLLADARLARDRVVVVPPGVDAQLPGPRQVDGGLVIGARLRRRADARQFVEAVDALRTAGLAVSAVVSAPDGLIPENRDGVRILPPEAVLAECDVLVELCVADLPMRHVVDALAAGRPVVAVAAGLLPELVHDGRSGILIQPGDVQALTGALRQLAAADHRSAQAAGALQSARRHDIAIVGDALLGVYRAAIGGTAAGGATTWKRLTTERLRRRTSNRHRKVGP